MTPHYSYMKFNYANAWIDGVKVVGSDGSCCNIGNSRDVASGEVRLIDAPMCEWLDNCGCEAPADEPDYEDMRHILSALIQDSWAGSSLNVLTILRSFHTYGYIGTLECAQKVENEGCTQD